MLPLLWTGCQNYAQHDLIVRELRTQEDQLYAMEDYLAQYQQLVSMYRAENAELKSRLGDLDGDTSKEETLPAPRRTRPAPNDRGPPPVREPEPAPAPDLELPDVPPLEPTASHRRASGDRSRLPRDVWLHGAVLESEPGGGPRLVIDVSPLDAQGQPADFIGPLSLMVLAPDSDDAHRDPARWDFTTQEVQAAAEAGAGGTTLRFHLELSPDIQLAESSQLWVRLLPRGGDKLLAHAPIDLRHPGTFSSNGARPRQRELERELPVLTAGFRSQQLGTAPPVESEMYDGGWTIARPGEVGSALPSAAPTSAQWRRTDESLPANLVDASIPPRRTQTAERSPSPDADHTAAQSEPSAAVEMPQHAPRWSPERPDRAPRTASQQSRPTWSPTR